MVISGRLDELEVRTQIDVPAHGVAAVRKWKLEAQFPVAPIDTRTQVERCPLRAEWIECRRSVLAFRRKGAGNAADRQLALDGHRAVVAQIDPRRREREARMFACRE